MAMISSSSLQPLRPVLPTWSITQDSSDGSVWRWFTLLRSVSSLAMKGPVRMVAMDQSYLSGGRPVSRVWARLGLPSFGSPLSRMSRPDFGFFGFFPPDDGVAGVFAGVVDGSTGVA